MKVEEGVEVRRSTRYIVLVYVYIYISYGVRRSYLCIGLCHCSTSACCEISLFVVKLCFSIQLLLDDVHLYIRDNFARERKRERERGRGERQQHLKSKTIFWVTNDQHTGQLTSGL